MQDFIRKNKYAVGIIGFVLLLIVLYYGFFTGGAEAPQQGASSAEETDEQTATDTIRVGTEVTQLRRQLREIELSNSVFSNRVYNQLRPFRFDIAEKQSGRSNPLAPIGQSSSKDLRPIR
jgi:hypothetical protein